MPKRSLKESRGIVSQQKIEFETAPKRRKPKRWDELDEPRFYCLELSTDDLSLPQTVTNLVIINYYYDLEDNRRVLQTVLKEASLLPNLKHLTIRHTSTSRCYLFEAPGSNPFPRLVSLCCFGDTPSFSPDALHWLRRSKLRGLETKS